MLRSASGRAVCVGCLFTALASPAPQSSELPAHSSAPHWPVSPNEALLAAVRHNDAEQVKHLLAAGADVDARDVLGTTGLGSAAWHGYAALAILLLAHGADANASQSGTSTTPLTYAVLAGHADVVQLLVSAGARPDVRDSQGRTLLHLASRSGDPQSIAVLLRAGLGPNQTDANGLTPLDEAILNRRAGASSLLLANGADVRTVHRPDGRGPLHEACLSGFAALIRPLVAAGANPVARDRSGQTPLDLALAYKSADALRILLALSPANKEMAAVAEDAMEAAVVRGETEVARMLIDAGFDCHKPTARGSTYLNEAALKGQRRMVQLLLDQGAPIEAYDRSGATALHDAALGGNADVIRLLLDRGARIDASDREAGATPLMLAASFGRTTVVALLLDRGADARVRDRSGHTALDRARESGADDTVRLLETAVANSQTPPPRAT